MLKPNLSISPARAIHSLNPQVTSQPFVSKPQTEQSLSCEEDFDCLLTENLENLNSLPYPAVQNEEEISAHWMPEDPDYITSLIDKECEYLPSENYFDNVQPYLTPNMRSILYDWMMEVCSELMLKRESYHLAVSYVDRYMSIIPGVTKQNYQLIGLTCMYIAAKTEEVIPPYIGDWVSSADNGYSLSSIFSAERGILQALSYNIFPVTTYNWLSFLMTQWDTFLDYHFGCVPGNNPNEFPRFSKKQEKEFFEERMIFFKQSNQKAYKRFREAMQILDLSLLHSHSLKFLPRHMASGLLYLMICKYFFETNYALLYFTGSSQENVDDRFNIVNDDPYSLENNAAVQDMFCNFIKHAAKIDNLDDLYQVVSFYHSFLDFEALFDLPVVCRVQSRSKLESHYEDFLAFQTHNIKNLDFLTNSIAF